MRSQGFSASESPTACPWSRGGHLGGYFAGLIIIGWFDPLSLEAREPVPLERALNEA